MSSAPRTRLKYISSTNNADLNLAHLPPPGIVSILHRLSGALLFFPVLPLVLYAAHKGLGTQMGFESVQAFVAHPLFKLFAIAAIWLYAHHFFAGIRYLLLDLHIGIEKAQARASAVLVLVMGVAAAAIVGVCIW
jgi:succinate dehydrogenase / fumarate reductase cytochrome b subunit